ncbi:MAG: MFS transporter [Actinomycetota bacterium]|nr:MFS transporter [Actinomycetota bacterium]
MTAERKEGKVNPGLGRLREDGPFIRFWLAHTVTVTGTTVSYVVLPILVFQRTGSAAHTAAIVAIAATPYLLIGLVAGAVADRSDRRRLMVGCELACAALVGSAPVAAAFDVLTLPHIYAVALGSATAFVFFDAANFGALPALVGQPRLVAAISTFEATDGVAHIAGPALGGLLATIIGPEQALAVDAASYLISGLLLLSVRRPLRGSAPVHRGASMRAEIGEGLRYLWQHPMIRALTMLGFGLSASLGAAVGLLIVYGVHQLGLESDDWRIGLLFSAGSAGALMASAAFPYVRRHVPVPWISLTGFGLSWTCLGVMAAIDHFETALVAYFGFLAACQLAVINGITYRQSATPDELRGRVNVVARMIAWGGHPFGAAIGGALASAFGVRTALVVGSLGVGASFVVGLFGPLRRIDATDAQ